MISKNHWKGAQTTRSRLVPSDGRGMEADLVAMEDVWGLEPKIMEGEEVSKSGELKNWKRIVWILSLLCCGLEEQNLCHALAPPWMMILTCRQRLTMKRGLLVGIWVMEPSSGSSRPLSSSYISYILYTKMKGIQIMFVADEIWIALQATNFQRNEEQFLQCIATLHLGLFFPYSDQHAQTYSFLAFWNCSHFAASRMDFPDPVKTLLFLFKELPFATCKNADVERHNLDDETNHETGTSLGEAGTCSLWASTAICKGCLEDRKPFGGRGDLWKGKLHEPKM